MIPWLHALAAMGDERWEDAIPALQRFLEMTSKPDDRKVACQNLSACYLALERYDEALAMLDQAAAYAPQDPDIMHSRGVICGCAARFAEAIAAFETLARRWPQQGRRYEVKKYIHQFQQAQRGKIAPGNYLAGHLQEQVTHNAQLGDWDLVERKARRMIAADPQHPEGYFALGLACLESNRYSEALQAFLNAEARDPNYAPTLYNIGHTYLQLGEPAQAIPWLERALHREPKHLNTLHQLGVAYERLGKRDEAITWWRRALKMDPTYRLAQERLHEVGQGPVPEEPGLPPEGQNLRAWTPTVKARMRRPQVYRNGGVTLTYDGAVGFVLEDTENPHNATIYAGGPFRTAHILDEDLMDLIGLVKLLLTMVNSENTRDVAVLAYYADKPIFAYKIRFARGEQIELEHHGRFVVTEVPRFFKLRMDSDLSCPYGDPMQGMLIYLKVRSRPSILISTMGLVPK